MSLRPILPSRYSVRLARLGALGLGVALASFGAFPAAAASSHGQSPSPDIASIGTQHISEDDVIGSQKKEFDQLQGEYDREMHQLQQKMAQARHDLLQKKLDALLDKKALDMEATSRGVGTDVVLADLKVSLVTDEEIKSFYDLNKGRIQQPFEQVSAQIGQYLTRQRNDAAARSFYDDLRAKHAIVSRLGPYRAVVAATGPARGPSSAPVTIVEFADFQCPYCKEAEASLHEVLARHPQEVRLVFRNLPLEHIHPHAADAANASVCADRQGKFWQMQDAMYDDQTALGIDALKATAQRVGLDVDQFSSCLSGNTSHQALDADAKAAQELGLSGTPYFFINGRPIDGNVPLEKFESTIADELRRAAHGPG